MICKVEADDDDSTIFLLMWCGHPLRCSSSAKVYFINILDLIILHAK